MASEKIKGKAPYQGAATQDGEYREVRVTEQGEMCVSSTDPTMTTRIDEVSSSVLYIGTAKIGTATSSALWQVQKVTVVGTVTGIFWADGNSNYDNVWDNRASLTYS